MSALNGEVRELAAGGDRLLERATFEFALDAHLLTDAYGVVLDANNAALHVFQLPKEFLVGKPLGVLVADPDRSAFYAWLARLPGTNSAETLAVRINRRGAEPLDVVAVAAALGERDDGRPLAYRWLFRDVSGPRQAERELQRERQLLEGVVDAADAIILVVDSVSRVLRSNAY